MYKKSKLIIKNKLLQKKLKKSKKVWSFDLTNLNSKSILIIDEIIPEYNKDSGSRRLYEIIKLLVSHNTTVFLLADLKEYKYKSSYIEKFEKLGVKVYQPVIDDQGKLVTKKIFIQKIAPYLDYAWLSRPHIFNKYHSLLRQTNSNVELLFDMVDFHYLRFMREWNLDQTNDTLKEQADFYLQMEILNCNNADKVVVISDLDQEALTTHYNEKSKMITIGNVHDYISKKDDFVPFNKRQNLLFVGGFNHTPNVDAVLFLKNEIMPIVWQTNPDILVQIIGSYPTEVILNLNSDKFKVLGFVEDITTLFQQSKLFIAPLRFGAGVKGKIGQSLEYSLPLITTNIGAEGFDFNQFSDQMIAGNADDFAQKIIELYSNATLWNNISNSSESILHPFSIQNIKDKLAELNLI